MNGYLTQTDIINLGLLINKVNLDTAKLKDLIDSDLSSKTKQDAADGVKYYMGEHDILKFVRYYNVDGLKQQYVSNINNKIPHPFHQILVDQKVYYICGVPISLSVKEDEKSETIKEILSEYTGDVFNESIAELIKGASNKSFETLHFYVNSNGDLKYVIVPSEQIIPIYDTQYQNELLYVMRYYQIDEVTTNGNVSDTQKRYKVEWWSKTQVEYFVETSNGQDTKFIHDPDYSVNPAPHWALKYEPGDGSEPQIVGKESWGKVPFILLWNNEQEINDLKRIKALIDGYDKVKSGLCNDIEEFNKLLFVLKGFTGLKGETQPGQTQLQLFIENWINEGAIAVEGEGSVDTIKGDIPLEAREKFLKLTREEIFFFGRGVDVASDKLGSDPSGVALKFMYSNLDLKANEVILKLRPVLKEFAWFPIEWENRNNQTQLDSSLVDFVVTKSQIFNEKEKG